MNNSVFLDSSILVEALKGNKVALYQELVTNHVYDCCINEVVASEYLFYLLAYLGGSSPKTLKERMAIKATLEVDLQSASILTDFTILGCDLKTISLVPSLMATYNLLPNDAIILATCKIHGITRLASHDADFILPCKNEGIALLNEPE